MLALIMAGGSGTRFWPKSRRKHPKQLLKIHGDKTMIQHTVDRLQPTIPPENIFIVTTAEQRAEISAQLPQIPSQNIIVEPIGKNTAPCIGLGALYMRRVQPEAAMVVLPADHYIGDEDAWMKQLLNAEKIALASDALVTIGIQPTHPATGYGYIQFESEAIAIDSVQAYRVKTFAEKPNYETACRFLESGDFLWNSGIFVWKISLILRKIEEHLPEISDSLNSIDLAIGKPGEKEAIDTAYRQFRNISIDYGVMENARDVFVLPGNFQWNDLGSWDEVFKISTKDEHGNSTGDGHIHIDTEGCLIEADGKVVATIGLRDVVIVDTQDALLICPRERAQEVKEIVEILKRRKLNHLL